jgi:bifunctional non-homologous end joining protein LigD
MKITYGRYTLTLSNLDKPLLGTYTKGDIITYYASMAPYMVPYLKDHPLMMHRFPEGLTGESFYQKDVSDYFPAWIKRIRIEKTDGYYHALLCQNQATLVYLANQACITPHLWLSRYDKLATPDRLIFDLDPSSNDFSQVRTLALSLKQLLDTLQLASFVMTTGSRGLHIYIPLRRSISFDVTKEFAQLCARHLIAKHPDLCTLEIRKDKRHQKVFIDTLRNQQGATAVAPYAIRGYPTAPIATPLFWKEVEDRTLSPQKYTISSISKRLTEINDPWKDFFKLGQSLTHPMKVLKKGAP